MEKRSLGVTSNGRLRPFVLLAGTGAMLGLSTSAAKLGTGWGINPLALLAWPIAGATAILFVIGAARNDLPGISLRTFEYFTVAAFVTVAASNLIFFSAVPRVGASFVALAIAFPPMLTYLGALALRMERFEFLRACGVAAALAGAALLALFELDAPDASAGWIGLTFLGPVLLAVGNLYRTLRWPPGASADALAPGMLLAATVWLFAAALLPGLDLALPLEAWAVGLTLAQAGLFAGQFLLLFALQRAGGPVVLSLLGAVGAVVGVPVAVGLLGEDVPVGLPYAVPLIALGVGLIAWGGRRDGDKQLARLDKRHTIRSLHGKF